MAKKSAPGAKSLVIVESPAKARTISKFLGSDFVVEASIGHVRDLPKGSKEMPAELKKEKWAYLGVNVDDGFTPVYIVPANKKPQVAKLRLLLKDAKDLYLATDEDREGEAISWHLHELLKPKVPVHRLVFHEITDEAIHEALAHPRDIDQGLVSAQETRRILDRLYGYEVSKLLWRKVKPKLSAGRVQSVAVRLIVQRERERMAFRSATYWDLLGHFATQANEAFDAALMSVDGRGIPSGKDFDSATGKLKNPQLLLLDEAGASELQNRLRNATFRVTNVENKPYTTKPAPPFTTSTLQQEANRKLGFGARRTMDNAQRLYENGYITYMRTDSTNLAQVAIDAARDLVRSEYGAQFLTPEPRIYKSKVKNAQEAHEAIRPAGHPFKLPEAVRNELPPDQYRLFDMIWKRTVASQMADARGNIVRVTIEGDGAVFTVSGKTIEFPGFLRAYVEGSDDPDAALSDRETVLPAMRANDVVQCRELEPKSHTTQPPARFSEASLTKTLEEMGIGRPSTYASILETIIERDYVSKRGNALVPTWVAFSVSKLMEEHLANLVDYQFTAQMEDLLDAISRKEAESLSYLKDFYFGNGHTGLKQKLEEKILEIDPRDMSRFSLGKPDHGPHREEVFVRVGKYGPFLEQGERKSRSVPEDLAPDELTQEKALELLEQASKGETPLGYSPEGRPVFVKTGRFGPYVQMNSLDGEEKPKNASIPKGLPLTDVTMEMALKWLSLPKTLGQHPETKEDVIATSGPYGPYVKSGKESRSLPADLAPTDVTLEQALHFLSQPKTRGRGRATPEPLKVFEPSPVTKEPIKLLSGRYGAYVTDGTTNATLPRDITPEACTFEDAVRLLEERAAKGPPVKKGRGKKKAAKKKS